MIFLPKYNNARHHRAPALVALACVALPLFSSLLGCSTSQIQESDLSITPTEPPTSFSRSSQSSIEDLHLTPDRLADPEHLATASDVAGLNPANRSLLLSEAWYLRGQNDIDVPIAISLDRFLRAAHFAYDSIFAGSVCLTTNDPLCSDLHSAYNRASREVARLTNNGTQLPDPSPDAYTIDSKPTNGALEITEWDLLLDDKQNSAGTTLGASGTACQTRSNTASPSTMLARLCSPAAFLVTFDSRADEGRSRAHLGAHATSHSTTISLHEKEVKLPSDHRAAWSALIEEATSEKPIISCLADVEPLLPTVIFVPQDRSESSEWPLIATALSSDGSLSDHYNFCVLSSPSTQPATTPQESIAGALNAISTAQPQKLTIVLIVQGSENDSFARDLKRAIREGAPTSSAPLNVAGSLTLPSPPIRKQDNAALAPLPPAELSKGGHSAVTDSKRLLSKLADQEDGVFGGVSRKTVASQPGMTISPVM